MFIGMLLLLCVQSGLPHGFEPPKSPAAVKAASTFPDTQLMGEVLSLIVSASRKATPEERAAVLQGSDEVHQLGSIAFKPHPSAEELGRLGHLARALFFSGELNLDASSDGPAWTDIPRNVVLEACNGYFASLEKPQAWGGSLLQFISWGDVTSGERNRRQCMLARQITLPLVQDGTIHVIGKAPTWELDSAQWATFAGMPLRESSEKLITCLKYDPFHLSEVRPAFGKDTEIPREPRHWGSKAEPAKLVTVDGLNYIGLPVASSNIEQDVSANIYTQLTKMVIPAGRAAEDGSFIPPSDAELVAYCSKEYGARFDSSGRVRIDPRDKIGSK